MLQTGKAILLLTTLILVPCISKSVPQVDNSLEQFLSSYYDNYVKLQEKAKKSTDPLDGMQGDQPMTENTVQNTETTANPGFSYVKPNGSTAEAEYIKAMKDRAKENWIQILKENILRQMGRDNSTMSKKINEIRSSSSSMDTIPSFLNNTNGITDDQITEKIRGFYPSCDVPVNTDQDLWKNDDVMNLYFNYDYIPEDRNTNIATATLRLYRIPENGTKIDVRSVDCEIPPFTDEDKLLRISVYWYTKSLKKRRVKHRRLSDSRVVSNAAKWVELSVKPATKAWSRGKNLGLAVVVEDQEGNTLKADKYFKGATCMVGTSTPKPIPTIIIDAAKRTNELEQVANLLGRNTTAALYSDVHLLPTIDICTLEFPKNYSQPEHIMNLRINACNLKKINEQTEKQVEQEKIERLKTLPEFLMSPPRHIRHQRGHSKVNTNNEGLNNNKFDPRSKMEGATVLITHDELKNFTQKMLNFSTVNR